MPVKRTARKNHSNSADALTLLKSDHANVKSLLKKLQNATNRDRQRNIFAQIDNELQAHTRIEEEVFYPAFKAAVKGSAEQELYFEAIEEHHVVDLVLPAMRTTSLSKELFSAKAKVLQDVVEHHIEKEEGRMFPKARKAMGAQKLQELGRRMQLRKDQISVGMWDQSLELINPFVSRTFRPASRQKADRTTARKRAA
jgi:hemerythrin superfamily protein